MDSSHPRYQHGSELWRSHICPGRVLGAEGYQDPWGDTVKILGGYQHPRGDAAGSPAQNSRQGCEAGGSSSTFTAGKPSEARATRGMVSSAASCTASYGTAAPGTRGDTRGQASAATGTMPCAGVLPGRCRAGSECRQGWDALGVMALSVVVLWPPQCGRAPALGSPWISIKGWERRGKFHSGF